MRNVIAVIAVLAAAIIAVLVLVPLDDDVEPLEAVTELSTERQGDDATVSEPAAQLEPEGTVGDEPAPSAELEPSPQSPQETASAETAERAEPIAEEAAREQPPVDTAEGPDPAREVVISEPAERLEPAVETESPPAEPVAAAESADAETPSTRAQRTQVVRRVELENEPDPEPDPTPKVDSGSAAPEEVAALTEDVAPPEPVQPAETPEPVAPSFDVVRIDQSGRAVIAGRAEPGAEVSVRVDRDVVATATANARGEWVAIPTEPLSSGPSEIDLAATDADGANEVLSESVVVVDVPPRAETVAIAEPEPPPEPLAEESVVDTAASESPVETGVDAPQPEPTTPIELDGAALAPEAVAVLLPREGEGPIKVLQAPRSSEDGGLRLEVIDYDAEGDIVLLGRATAGTTVRAFIDDTAVGVAPSFEGTWRLVPEGDVAPGRHALRVEEVSEAGVVVASFEMPFSRAAPDDIQLTAGQVIVQPGNSLWRIARRAYGQGIRYTIIFLANRDQITEADLIYPGQVFTLPRTE